MFKRLFILSGIIAFVLSCAMMWYWYLPMKERERNMNTNEKVEDSKDSTSFILPESVSE